MNYSFYIQHLQRQADRKQRFIEHHKAKGYVESSFHFHHSRDGADYSDANVM